MASAKDTVSWIMLIMLVILNVGIAYNHLQLDCDKCTVEFSNSQIAGIQLDKPRLVAEVKMNDLYKGLVDEGHCIIKWDRNQGFYRA